MPKTIDTAKFRAEYIAALHDALDKAIEKMGGRCNVNVSYGMKRREHPNGGYYELAHSGAIQISLTPSDPCGPEWEDLGFS